MKQHVFPGKRTGEIVVPASKSDGQRALLCAALASGVSKISGLGISKDEQAMLTAIQALGAEVLEREHTLYITGMRKPEKSVTLHAGESGLGFRLLCGTAGAFSVPVTLTGSGSLLARPMAFWDEVFPKLGVSVTSNRGFAPLTICGPYRVGNAQADGSASSQYISGLLIGLVKSGLAISLEANNLVSGAYVDMTLETMRAFGVTVYRSGNTFSYPHAGSFRAAEYRVEADWSSAGYWLVAAALGHSIVVRGLNQQSKQADKALLEVLVSSGCTLHWEENRLQVTPPEAGLKAFDFDAGNCPDLFPALVVLASQCAGTSRISGVGRLRHKESDRAASLQDEFKKMGLAIEISGDVMEIPGTTALMGAVVDAHNDHRIAMCLAIAATIASGETTISDAACVSKSYPEFWEHLDKLTKA